METAPEIDLSAGPIPSAPTDPAAATLAARDLHFIQEPGDAETWHARTVIGITVHNNAHTIACALTSAIDQLRAEPLCAILILDDQSTDDWRAANAELLRHPRVLIAEGRCGSAARARNAVLDLIDDYFPYVEWVARLDGDDAFSTPTSLAAACACGRVSGSLFVLGGNRLVNGGQLLEKTNPATLALFDPNSLLNLLEEMAAGRAPNELPSCNLLLRARSGIRYPDVTSAEDHFLVSRLLLLTGDRGAVLEHPYLMDYSIDGNASARNREQGKHSALRTQLSWAAKVWMKASLIADRVLGVGGEGIVIQRGDRIEKYFYPNALSETRIPALSKLLLQSEGLLPKVSFGIQDQITIGSYAAEGTTLVADLSDPDARNFLTECLRTGVVCLDIKRSNFRRRTDGSLMFVDFGADIREFTIDYFLDSAARLYALAILKWPDDELKRRATGLREDDALNLIPGFADFYRDLLHATAKAAWGGVEFQLAVADREKAANVTLLIKCCAMDARELAENVRHILTGLAYPTSFAKRVLLIDPHTGPFLRQHNSGDAKLLRDEAEELRRTGWLDEVWVAPSEPTAITEINGRWFGLECRESHTSRNIPVSPQLWAFDRVTTRYVLQCDVDILIGRRDWEHAYLEEMLVAIASPDVICVAFNIPKPPAQKFCPYAAPPGGYVPEVRCGLLDCVRLRGEAPLPNAIESGRLRLSWYRALEQRQLATGLKTVRGGDPRTFYVHPANAWKQDTATLASVRSQIASTRLPECQLGAWDLAGTPNDWKANSRAEDLIFLVKGRNTPPDKIWRCFNSLYRQDDQEFGLIVMDDNSDEEASIRQILMVCRRFGDRITFVRNHQRKGHLANIDFAATRLCSNPESLIIILDMDDALFARATVAEFREAYRSGGDVIWGGPFRPEKPLKSYHPGRNQNPRMFGGDDVWIHLRSFRRKLYDRFPKCELRIGENWIPECTDYALMIPISELAEHPLYISKYLCWHERSAPVLPNDRLRKDQIIRAILSRPKLIPTSVSTVATGPQD